MNLRNFGYVFICLLFLTFVIVSKSINAQQGNTPDVLSDENGELTNQGVSRTYYLHTPKSYNRDHPMPLVLVFHGDNGSGRSISKVTRFNTLADEQGFVVAYPNAIDQKWSLRNTSSRKVDDVAFVNALIDHLEQIRNIDRKKIYATGFSKGAILTQALACEQPNKIAAFASVAGSLPARLESNCQSRPVSMLAINGTNDLSVHYQGDNPNKQGGLISIPAMVNFWREHDQCPSKTSVPRTPTSSDIPRLETYRYSDCRGGSEISELLVVDGGHMWPGGLSSDPNLQKFNSKLGLNASQTIWKFFQRRKLS